MPRASGFDQWVLNKTGYAVAGGIGSGSSQKIAGGGAVYAKSGFAAAGLTELGASASMFVESGFAAAGDVAAGARVTDHPRSGYAVAGGVAAGPCASMFVESGSATIGGVASGASATGRVSLVKSGGATAGATAAGRRNAVYGHPAGAGVAGLVARGVRTRILTRTGSAVLEGTGGGVRLLEHNRGGHGIVGTRAFGDTHERYPARPPGQISRTELGRLIRTAQGVIDTSHEGVVNREPGPTGGWIETPKQGMFG